MKKIIITIFMVFSFVTPVYAVDSTWSNDYTNFDYQGYMKKKHPTWTGSFQNSYANDLNNNYGLKNIYFNVINYSGLKIYYVWGSNAPMEHYFINGKYRFRSTDGSKIRYVSNGGSSKEYLNGDSGDFGNSTEFVAFDQFPLTTDPIPPPLTAPIISSGEWVEMPNYMSKTGGKYKISWTTPDTVTGFEVFRNGTYLAGLGNVNYYYTDIAPPYLEPFNNNNHNYTVYSIRNTEKSSVSNTWTIKNPYDVPLLIGNIGWLNRLPANPVTLDIFNKDKILKGVSSLLVASGFVFATYDEMQDATIDFLASTSISAWDSLQRTFDNATGNSISLDQATRDAVNNYRDNVVYTGETGSGIAIPQNPSRVITPPVTIPKQVSIPYDIPVPTDAGSLVNKDTTVDPTVTTDTGVISPTYPSTSPTVDDSMLDTLKKILGSIADLVWYILSLQWITDIIQAIESMVIGLVVPADGYFQGKNDAIRTEFNKMFGWHIDIKNNLEGASSVTGFNKANHDFYMTNNFGVLVNMPQFLNGGYSMLDPYIDKIRWWIGLLIYTFLGFWIVRQVIPEQPK